MQTETKMRLILPILLIPMVLASQSLCALHTHIGRHSAELDGHGGNPHFHAVHGHSHGHGGLHSNGGGSTDKTSEVHPSSLEEFPVQYTGAYYVPDSVSRGVNRPTFETLSELLVKVVSHRLPTLSLGAIQLPKADRPHQCRPSDNARVPLFLRDASIRC